MKTIKWNLVYCTIVKILVRLPTEYYFTLKWLWMVLLLSQRMNLAEMLKIPLRTTPVESDVNTWVCQAEANNSSSNSSLSSLTHDSQQGLYNHLSLQNINSQLDVLSAGPLSARPSARCCHGAMLQFGALKWENEAPKRLERLRHHARRSADWLGTSRHREKMEREMERASVSI